MRTTNRFLKTSMLLGLFAAMPTSGCIAPTVVGGNDDTSSSSSDTTSSSMTSSVGGSPPTSHAVAIRAGSMSGTGGGMSTTVGVGGSGGGMSVATVGSGVGGGMTSGAGGSMTAGVGGSMTAGVGGSMTAGVGGSMTAGVGGGMTSGAGGAPSFNPDTLYLEIDSNPISCADPSSTVVIGSTPPCNQSSHIHVELPPAAQTIGTYTFNDGSGVNVFTELSMDSCGGGYSNFFDEVRVISVTSTTITVQIVGAMHVDGNDPNGLYVIPRCEPTEAPPTRGIAIHPSDIPPPPNGTSVGAGGAPPSSTDLVLVLHDHDPVDTAAVCADPYGEEAACENTMVGGWEISVTLPQMYQQPGTYQLNDPNLNATFGEWEPAGGGCAGGGGSFWEGSLEVKSVGGMGIIARFHGPLADHNEITATDIYYAPCDLQ